MMQNMQNMMSGTGTEMFFWVALATIVILLLAGVTILLISRWLRSKRPVGESSMLQQQASYHDYEQGYQPQQQPSTETYQEGGQRFVYPQPPDEQPQAQYPHMAAPKY